MPTVARKSPLVTREAVSFGLMGAAAVTAVMIAVVSAQGYGALLRSDAQHFYRVALDPFGDGRIFAGSEEGAGTAYRYGRILFPLAAWVLALGQRPLIPVTLPLAYIISVLLFATLACARCARAGRPPIVALAALLVPSAFFTVPLLVPEFLIAGLVLLVYDFAETKRTGQALVAAVLLLLARETAALAFLPLILPHVRRREWRALVRWSVVAIPLLLWYVCSARESEYGRFSIPAMQQLEHSIYRCAASSLRCGGSIPGPRWRSPQLSGGSPLRSARRSCGGDARLWRGPRCQWRR